MALKLASGIALLERKVSRSVLDCMHDAILIQLIETNNTKDDAVAALQSAVDSVWSASNEDFKTEDYETVTAEASNASSPQGSPSGSAPPVTKHYSPVPSAAEPALDVEKHKIEEDPVNLEKPSKKANQNWGSGLTSATPKKSKKKAVLDPYLDIDPPQSPPVAIEEPETESFWGSSRKSTLAKGKKKKGGSEFMTPEAGVEAYEVAQY